MNWNPGEAGKETRQPEDNIGYTYPYENKWDVLRRSDLPEGDNIGIDYRVEPEQESDRRQYCIYLLVTLAVFTLVVIFLSHLLGDFLAKETLFILAIACGVFFALRQLLEKQEWMIAGIIGLFAPGLWLVMTVPAFFSPTTLLLIGSGSSVLLADAIATHYVMWLGADPNLSDAARGVVKEKWQARWRAPASVIGVIFLIIYITLLIGVN